MALAKSAGWSPCILICCCAEPCASSITRFSPRSIAGRETLSTERRGGGAVPQLSHHQQHHQFLAGWLLTFLDRCVFPIPAPRCPDRPEMRGAYRRQWGGGEYSLQFPRASPSSAPLHLLFNPAERLSTLPYFRCEPPCMFASSTSCFSRLVLALREHAHRRKNLSLMSRGRNRPPPASPFAPPDWGRKKRRHKAPGSHVVSVDGRATRPSNRPVPCADRWRRRPRRHSGHHPLS